MRSGPSRFVLPAALGDKRLSRFCLGLAVSFVLAACLATLLAGWKGEIWVLVLAPTAMVVAVLRPLASRVAWGLPVVNIVLAALTFAAFCIGPREWVALLLGLAVAAGCIGLLVHLLGRKRGIAGALVLMLAAAGLGLRSGPDLSQYHVPLHTWNQFHYVLGTKYFDELEYFDIYKAILLADQEGDQQLTEVPRVRDLHSYEYMTRDEALQQAEADGLRARFTDERWSEFESDLAVFFGRMPKGIRRGVITDLGFNPSPAWLILHRPFLNAVDLHGGRGLEAFALLQVPLYIGTLAALWWAFGLRGMLWISLWTALFFGNRGRLIGGYFSYDWFMLGMVAMAFVARGRASLAAPMLAYGGLMRGFVGLLCIGPVVGLVTRLRGGKDAEADLWSLDRPTTRFLVVLGAAMAIIGVLSLTTPLGTHAWVEWYEKISLHAHRISAGANHLGLKTLFGEDYLVPGLSEGMDLRREILARQLPACMAVQAILVLWSLWVMRRRTRLDACILGLIPAFAVMVLSRYYYASWVIFLVLGTTPENREGRVPVQLCMFGFLVVYQLSRFTRYSDLQGRYQVANMAILALSVAALATYTIVDLRSRRAG
jgi:hypothetical protein